MNSAALDVQSLSFSIGDARILKDISFRIMSGETWSILGPNGSGKSTLLKCLMRIHRNWHGSVSVFGRPMQTYSQRELAGRIAYVPQAGGDHLFLYTVRQFVTMGRYPYAGPFRTEGQKDRAVIEAVMRRTGTDIFADRTMNSLSGGERQKVFIAAALAQESDILLLDEPTAFLDYRHQGEVMAILRSLNRESGCAVLNVTHDINSAILTGGNVLALRSGKVAYHGPVEGLVCEKQLRAIFDATFRFIDDPVTGARLIAPQEAAI